MITSKKAMQITFERDDEKRNAMVDALSEQSAKDLLKVCLKAQSNQMHPMSNEVTP
ncbi:hypothetical protein OBV_24140 [Oscillibacter valericigenes Sjm18-20]|nr:hypothetical protein OBV_24140 [Oscillibacter valericigenes Sjm18-20]